MKPLEDGRIVLTCASTKWKETAAHHQGIEAVAFSGNTRRKDSIGDNWSRAGCDRSDVSVAGMGDRGAEVVSPIDELTAWALPQGLVSCSRAGKHRHGQCEAVDELG
jgi:hypothetical protein